MFSVEAMVHDYHGTRRLFNVPIENLGCEREVGNNYRNTFAVDIAKDGEGLHRCGLSLSFSAAFFQASEFVINLRMDP